MSPRSTRLGKKLLIQHVASGYRAFYMRIHQPLRALMTSEKEYMSTSTLRNGTAIAAPLPGIAQKSTVRPRKLASLQDLLDALEENQPHHIAMLRSTASKLAEFYDKPCAEISIELVEAERDEFRDYLRGKRYAPNSVKSYSNYASNLARFARQYGWTSSPDMIPAEWLPLIPAIRRAGSQRLFRYLLRQGRLPSAMREADLESWVEREVRSGRSYIYATRLTRSLRKVLVKSGLGIHLFPGRMAKKGYGISLESFPEPLRSEVKDAIQFRLVRFVTSRRNQSRIRPVTAENLRQGFQKLFGFALNIKGSIGIATLSDLMTIEIVGEFIEWALDDRQLKGCSIRTSLAPIASALSQNPKYSEITASWLLPLIKSIPEDSDDDTRRRKEEKYLPYETLRSISDLIRCDRRSRLNDATHHVAVSVRNELLMQWLALLPWRQLNIRNMRIGGDKPNLFKASFPKFTSMSKPVWLVEAEVQDPAIEVWQFHFSKEETKTKHEVRAVLPRTLVPLLEEYLCEHRPNLVPRSSRSDPGTLFLNKNGNPIRKSTLTDLVAHLTLKYGGRIVTPHLFRDAFALMWLERRPEDYLTLSKLLWHRNINTTIKIYGQRFNESAALRKMEEVFGL